MCTDDDITDDIQDPETYSALLGLRHEFPEQSFASCHFWYLYNNVDLERTRSKLKTLSNEDETEVSNKVLQAAGTEAQRPIDLGVFPAEIWQLVASRLGFNDLANLRFTNSALADIAAEFMITRIRFDLSFESFERLRSIAENERLCKGVRHIELEAGLLPVIGCVHHYTDHYNMETILAKPPPPGKKASPQAQRWYTRNLAKFRRELGAEYESFRKLFEAQKCLIAGPKEPLFECLNKFVRLEEVTISGDRCQHMHSQRFSQKYAQSGTVSTRIDPLQTTWELQNMIQPGIKSLFVGSMSLAFFQEVSGHSAAWLQSMFHSLEHVGLIFRDANLESRDAVSSILQDSNLSLAVAAAVNLKALTINLCSPFQIGELSHIMPERQSFHQLHYLTLDSFSASENELFTMLKLQPALAHLDLAEVMLSSGRWQTLLKRMRAELHLTTFYPSGLLEDAINILNWEMCDVAAWVDGNKILLGDSIDMYVTDPNLPSFGETEVEFELMWNPVERIRAAEFLPEEDLLMDYGPIDGSDVEDFYDSEGEEDDFNSGSDEESTVTAEENISQSRDDSEEAEENDTISMLPHDTSLSMDVD